MSASSEKKRRQEDKQLNAQKYAAQQREEEAKAKKSQLKWRLTMAGIALFVILSIVLNTSLPFGVTAVKVGGTAYSAAEMNYFYANAFYNNYEYMSMFSVDFNSPLKSQDCALSDGDSWYDYLVKEATESVKGLEAMYQKAVEEGYELSAEGLEAVETDLANLPTYAQSYGYSDVKTYLRAMYGTGVTEDVLRELVIKATLVNEFTAAKVDSYNYSDAELEAYYAENVDDYRTYDVKYYFVSAETEEVTDAEGNTTNEVVEGGVDAALADAKALAEQATDLESFEAAVKAYQEDGSLIDASGYLKSNLNSAYRDWASDEAREAGDVTTATSDTGAYVVMYMGMEDNHYNTVSMRHILIKTVDADGDGVYSDEEMAEAKAQVEEIAAQWEASDKTEETFAAMANELSEDDGSNTNGGLYTSIGKGNMVTEINDFLFEAGRKTGDTAVVHGNNGGYDGYHLVLFAGEGNSYHLELAKSDMMNADYTAWQDEIIEVYEVSTGLGHNLIGK